MNSVEVLRPGAKVKIAKDIDGIIEEIIIYRGFRVMYKVVWWSGRDRKSEWLHADEISLVEYGERAKIGFVS